MELTQKTYNDFKRELDTELEKSAQSFVRIGYLLKIARDTDILTESEYANVNDFAAAEYGLDKSQVSRFININDRFSKDGYSDCLQDQYKAFGYAKLAMMLTLPDSVIEEITPAYSKSDIHAIKEEYDTEAAIPPIETYLEGEKEEQQNMPTLLDKVLNQLFYDEQELFSLIHHQIKYGGETEDIKDALAPSGDSFHSVRIQGVGRKFLTTKENSETVTITDARNGDKECYTWQDITRICRTLINPDMLDWENWEQIYEEPYLKDEEEPVVAPVQPKSERSKDDKKPASKKISKVTKAKTPKKPENTKADKVLTEEKKEPLYGQQTIENYHEMLPESKNETEIDVNETEINVNETDLVVNDTSTAAVETSETGINPKADEDLTEDEKEAKEAHSIAVRVELLLKDRQSVLSLNTIQLAINYVNELKGILLYLESRIKTDEENED